MLALDKTKKKKKNSKYKGAYSKKQVSTPDPKSSSPTQWELLFIISWVYTLQIIAHSFAPCFSFNNLEITHVTTVFFSSFIIQMCDNLGGCFVFRILETPRLYSGPTESGSWGLSPWVCVFFFKLPGVSRIGELRMERIKRCGRGGTDVMKWLVKHGAHPRSDRRRKTAEK